VRRFQIAPLVLALLVVPAASVRAAGEWVRVRSTHFTIEGNASGRDLRAVARRLEQFRDVLGQLVPSSRLVTPTPLTVVVFAYNRDLKAVSPLYRGKPIDLGGYAVVSQVGASVAMSLEAGEAAYPIVFHEFAHLLISNAVPRLPLWASEGLAEYYGTFWLSADSRRAIVGRPLSKDQLDLMVGRSLIPMSQLLAAGHDSSLYNGPDQNRFYVQCWALVHYLLLDNQARAGQFTTFINRVAAGAPPETAFSETIRDVGTLESELSDFAHQLTFGSTQLTFPERVASDERFVEERMSPAQAEAGLGQLLVGLRRYDDARARFAAALKLDPDTASAHTGLGLIELVQDRPLPALPLLRKGAELPGSGATAHFALGLAALRCDSPDCAKQGGGPDTARSELLRAVEILPEFPDALSYLGYAELASGASLDDAERHLLAAIGFLPRREDYRLHLAQVYLARRDFAKAQSVLGPLAASSPDAATKERARQLLGRMADMRIAAAARNDPATTSPPQGGAATLTPLYRTVLDGERRVDGTLEAIECPRPGLVLVIRDATGSHRFTAPSFDKIQFVSYRDDLKGSVTCGPQAPASQVYLTFRLPGNGEPTLAPGIEGVVVAVEFLPRAK
jgi:tetratricopeptide (TPR) repeat protein